jgi:hypothetical protein
MTWRVLSLPADDPGGGMAATVLVTIIDFIRNVFILEAVRRVFSWKVRRG